MPDSTASQPRQRVVLMFQSWHGYQRSVMRGVADYAQRRGGWALSIDKRLDQEQTNAALPRGVDGVIVEAWHPLAHRVAARSPVPLVGVLAEAEQLGTPTFTDDDPAIVALALAHFRELGFRHVAYVDTAWALTGRRRAFEAAVAPGPPLVFPPAPMRGGQEKVIRALTRWLRGLPTPIGVFAHNVDTAREVMEACDAIGRRVPDEVAVLGFGGDELTCNLATPPISAIDGGGERIGYRAAEALDRLMRGERVALETTRIPPLRVVQRRSTDTLAVDDPSLAAALRLIRDTACDGATVDGVLAQVPMSRRMLEHACRKAIGRTPHQEIQRVRVAEAQRLLAQTELPLADVAVRAGFGTPSRLCQVFARAVGRSPVKYRENVRRG